MKSKVSAVIVLAVIFVAFTLMSGGKSAQENVPQCRGLARGKHAPATILLADGTGPMCFPSTGCGYRDLGLGSEERIPPTTLLADGSGPMCFPSTGCGYKNDALANRVRFDLMFG